MMSSSSNSSCNLHPNLPSNWSNIHPLTLSLYLSNREILDSVTNTDFILN